MSNTFLVILSYAIIMIFGCVYGIPFIHDREIYAPIGILLLSFLSTLLISIVIHFIGD